MNGRALFVFTNASRELDYPYSICHGTIGADGNGRAVRKVSVPEQHVTAQSDRYRAANAFALDEAGWLARAVQP
jgi:hypothetical protein